ncbi:helix-turn-helix domain-containing protein [Aerococcaceae bacterium NML180378]|nr:helix-turn-helix domain-containing protein [Aerococcaceae bacterium NML180378]MDO4775588.1 helix-turn-helix transcriptional regulator [Aerococcaceae bacterium]
MYDYATNIRKLRKQKNLKQTDLAAGICSQGMISKIEKKQLRPDIDLLILIAKKLDVSVGELIGEHTESQNKKYLMHITNLLNAREFDVLESYLDSKAATDESVLNNPAFSKWLKGVLLAMNHADAEGALQELNEALEIVQASGEPQDELVVRIYTTLASTYILMKDYTQSIKYCELAIALLPKTELDFATKQKVYYTLALSYSYQQNFAETIFHTQIAIQVGLENSSLYLLDDLYILLTNTYIETKEYDKALAALEKATLLADIKNHYVLKPYIERNATKLKQLMDNQ